MEEHTKEEEEKIQEFLNDVRAEINKISEGRRNTLVSVEEVTAQCAFWSKVLMDNYADLAPLVATLIERMEMKVQRMEDTGKYVH